MNHTKLATTKQVTFPIWVSESVKVKLPHQSLFLAKKLCKPTVKHSVFFAVACSRMISPRPAPSACDFIPVSKTLRTIFLFWERLADITISNVKVMYRVRQQIFLQPGSGRPKVV